MNGFRYKKYLISMVLVLALVAGGLLVSPQSTQAASIAPNMRVTLAALNSTYAATVFVGKPVLFTATVKNIGNVPLQVTANLTLPSTWVLADDTASDCTESLGVRKSCTTTWYFTPQAEGQVYLRVYVRGHYTDSNNADQRITQSPAFIFNVKPAKGSSTTATSTPIVTGGGSTGSTTPTNGLPNMSVTLASGNSTYASTVFAEKQLVMTVTVKNIGTIPLVVTAALTTPTGWELEVDPHSDCPDSLGVRKSCTITWTFTPHAAGQVYLRVYVRGAYTTSSGAAARITQSPAFIFNVKPAKVTQ